MAHHMSKVRSSDTKPEWIVRCSLHRLGFRYRLHARNLPGTPDLVFPKHRAVVFVHGCYWHRHYKCKDASMPRANSGFWAEKFACTKERDSRNIRNLHKLGWRTMILWECELESSTSNVIQTVANWLSPDTVSSERIQEILNQRSTILKIAKQKVKARIASYSTLVPLRRDDRPAGR